MTVDAGPLGLVERDESGGRNVKNYRFDPTHTASGYWQITDTTWRRYAPGVGVDVAKYPTADSAPHDTQKAVARTIFDHEGFAPWADYNPKLMSDLGLPGMPSGPSEIGSIGSWPRLPGDFANLDHALKSGAAAKGLAKHEAGMPEIAGLKRQPAPYVKPQQIAYATPRRTMMARAGAPSLAVGYREALSRILADGLRRA